MVIGVVIPLGVGFIIGNASEAGRKADLQCPRYLFKRADTAVIIPSRLSNARLSQASLCMEESVLTGLEFC